MQRDNKYRGLYACFMLKFSAFNLKVLSRCECFIPKWMKYSNDNVVCLVASTLLFDYSKLTTRTKTSTTSPIRITQLQWDTECIYIIHVCSRIIGASISWKKEWTQKIERKDVFVLWIQAVLRFTCQIWFLCDAASPQHIHLWGLLSNRPFKLYVHSVGARHPHTHIIHHKNCIPS